MHAARVTHHRVAIVAFRVALVLVASACARPAMAQTRTPMRPIGRVSFYTQALRLAPDEGSSALSNEVITAVQLELPESDGDRVEYRFDMRHRNSSARPARLSVYDAYAGVRLAGGRARLRAGRMWLSDLGGLGSVAGGMFEYRHRASLLGDNRFRVGGFGGLEPETYGFGSASQVRKAGAYAVVEGSGGRRHALGYVRISQNGLVERSVITMTNFVTAPSRVFIYQTAEYDLVGPAGQGDGRLSYVMVNAHGSPTDRIDVQGQYHRGHSVDARSVTDDIINGRPLRPGALEGLLFESAGGRVTVDVSHDVRLSAGYARDRNNRDSTATARITATASAADLAGTGIDATVSESWIQRPTGDYQSLYVSIGRLMGSTIYLTGDFSSSLAVARFTRSDGITIETRPRTHQISVSALVTLSRTLSVVTTVERMRDDAITDTRLLSGLAIRLR